MIYPSGTKIFLLIVVFFALHLYARKRPIKPFVGLSNNQVATQVIIPMIIEAFKWSLAGLALIWALTFYVPALQPPVAFMLAAALCGSLTITMAPTAAQTGMTPGMQRFRNFGLVASNTVTTFVAAHISWQGYMNAVVYVVVFMFLQMILDFAFSCLTLMFTKARTALPKITP